MEGKGAIPVIFKGEKSQPRGSPTSRKGVIAQDIPEKPVPAGETISLHLPDEGDVLLV